MLATLALALLASYAAASPVPQDDPSPTPVPLPTPLPTTAIHPNGNTGKCVDVQGGNISGGTPVQIYDCNGSDAQKFSFARGNGAVYVSGTNFCLDSGLNPADGTQVKIERCNKGLTQQWFYTDDDRLAVTGKGLCLDLTNGSTDNGNVLQVWACGDGNTNQVWTTNAVFA